MAFKQSISDLTVLYTNLLKLMSASKNIKIRITYKLLLLGHQSFIKNTIQTAVINIVVVLIFH